MQIEVIDIPCYTFKLMTATAHALVGGAIAASISNPAIGLPFSALSHPILDMVPHWDFGWGWRSKNKYILTLQATADLFIGVALAYYLFGKYVDLNYFFASIFLSEVWDFLMFPYIAFGWKFPPFSSFYSVQHQLQGKAKLPWGILTQAGTVVVILLFLRTVRF